MDMIFNAIKEISIETRKAEEMVIDALFDFGVLTDDEADKLHKMLESA